MTRSAPPPQLPLTIRRNGSVPLQSQIAEQIRQLVASGVLAPESRVPSTRALADQLDVSRNTVAIAYETLIGEGLLDVESSAGTRVSPQLPAAFVRAARESHSASAERERPPSRRRLAFRGRAPHLYDANAARLSFDFRLGQPDPSFFPLGVWRKLIAERIDRSSSALVRYGDPGGYMPLRTAIAEHLRVARGILCDAEQVVIVAGCQEGLNLVARLLVANGVDTVVESPCYEGAALVLSSYGGRLVAGPVDDEGIAVERLPDEAALAYVTPSHQFPLGPTLSLTRRLGLLEWARKTGAYLVEDDYDSDFRYEGSPLLALSALDPESATIYLGTFSKSIGPGIRLGYAVFPRSLAPEAIAAKGLLDNGHPWLEQAAAAEFLSSGGFERHLQRIRRRYLMRRDCLLDAIQRHFGPCRVDGAEGGMHVAWHLPPGAPSARTLQMRAREAGVGVYTLPDGPAHVLEPVEDGDRIVLLGYPCLAEEQIRSAFERIADAAAPGEAPTSDAFGSVRRAGHCS
jgi:GntR family transcriptional regulator/MocR family aminotransferase